MSERADRPVAGEPAVAGTPGGGVRRADAWPEELPVLNYDPSVGGGIARVDERTARAAARHRHPSARGARVAAARAPALWAAPPPTRPPRPIPAVDPITALELEQRIAARRRHPSGRARLTTARPATPAVPTMGYQPGLDGLRAVSVIVIMLYHAGFAWMHGGFFAVEVFFAASGFLITTLLVEEQERSGRISLGSFWARRARRLLPALGVLLATVAIVTLIAGTDSQVTTLRRDFPWSIFYLSNWGQILGAVPYWAADPPLLRHLWTLGIEEQYYLVWPLAFVALAKFGPKTAVRVLAVLAAASMVLSFVIHAGGPAPMGGGFEGADRVNFSYLSTITRPAALLLGSAAAFVWRPWRTAGRLRPVERARLGRRLDVTGGVLLGAFACVSATAVITEGYVYQWLLGLMSLVATGLVLVGVHPAATGMRRLFGWGPLVAIGKRSYGLYLWHWPVFVFAGAIFGEVGPFLVAVAWAALLSEISYRYVETPARDGTFVGWWRQAAPRGRAWFLSFGVMLVVVLVGAYAAVRPGDPSMVGERAIYQAPTSTVAAAPAAPAPPGADAGTAPTTSAAPTTVAATLPRRVTVVGDSAGYVLARNAPVGMDDTFVVTDGALPGCSVYDGGSIRTAREGVGNDFGSCDGWVDEWAEAVRDSDADIALVVLGAWDVFDLDLGDGEVLAFGSPEWDGFVAGQLQQGVEALAETGARVALLEVPCMRPQDVEGAGVPALPERADDARVAHVNDVFRQVAAANADTTAFVPGPAEYCADEAMAADLGLRWDGVHATGTGAALVYESITDALLAL